MNLRCLATCASSSRVLWVNSFANLFFSCTWCLIIWSAVRCVWAFSLERAHSGVRFHSASLASLRSSSSRISRSLSSKLARICTRWSSSCATISVRFRTAMSPLPKLPFERPSLAAIGEIWRECCLLSVLPPEVRAGTAAEAAVLTVSSAARSSARASSRSASFARSCRAFFRAREERSRSSASSSSRCWSLSSSAAICCSSASREGCLEASWFAASGSSPRGRQTSVIAKAPGGALCLALHPRPSRSVLEG
mmetsp:Transcript_141300/g.393808  ORF Transcript_141300/g.393808 Transcript_141300/m.393808 type:complete len:252 (+) Transcript_141300:1438-2193(+)